MKRVLCVILLFTLLLAGCNSGTVTIDDSAFRPQTTAMLDAVLAEDFDACRELVTDQVDDESLRVAVEQMNGLLSQVESYTLQPVSWNKNVHNGLTQSTIRYEMSAEAGDFYVDVTMVEDVEGLVGFYVSPIQRTTVTGTLGSMKGASLLQWLVLLLGIGTIGFILWMAVDCLRHKFKGRIGWLLLILLIGGVASLSFSAGKISFRFNVGVFVTMSALLKESGGAMMLKLHVPIGAIVYWFRRGKLHRKSEEVKQEISSGLAEENPADLPENP